MPQKAKGKVPTGSAIGATMFRRMQKDKRSKRVDAGTGFHVADLESSSNPLQSVTQASSMEEFMAVASMSERDFTAERGQLTFVDDARGAQSYGAGGGGGGGGGARGGSFGPIVTPQAHEAPSGTIRNLQIPRRPRWDGKSPEELQRAEKDAFLDWRREVARAELAHGGGLSGADAGVEAAAVTPFEKNIDVWRQLWRVVERCDVLVQIVDARNPLLYRCPDLEDYVREVNPLKRCLLLINKADYLTHAQRGVWARHLRALGVRFVFFSARQEQLGLEEMDRRQLGQLPGARAEAAAAPLQSARLRPAAAAAARRKASRWDMLENDEEDDEGAEGAGEAEDEGEGEARDSGAPSPNFAGAKERSASAGGDDCGGASGPLGAAPIPAAATLRALPADDAARIFSRDELLDFFATEYADLPRGVLGSSAEAAAKKRAEKAARDREVARRERRDELARRRELNERLIDAGLGAHVRFGDEADVAGAGIDSDGDSLEEDEEEERPPPLQIGMVGYPNVGKSSTINALTGATAMRHGSQRVAVASTPGKTKHFQTITLDDDITLCDCPGLVFPSFVHSREEMVVNGILPIDQLRDHVSPIRLVCQRIPRETLEATYGFRLEAAGAARGTPLRRQPTPTELLDTYCRMRGFAAAVHSGWDHPRGARILLKDFCEGKLVYCHPPPGGPWASHLSGAVAVAASKGALAIDNVLKASVVQKRSVRLPPTSPLRLQAATTTAPHADQAASFEDDGDVEGEEGEAVDRDASSDGEDSADSSEIDEADLLAFSRVVVIPRGEDGGDDEDEDENADGDDDEEDEEADQFNASSRSAGGSRADLPPPPPDQSRRGPRVKGLGRHGGIRKGARDPDPYGTSLAADAANRKDFVAEVLKVSNGTNVVGGESATAAAVAGAEGATVPLSAPEWVASRAGRASDSPTTKKVRDIGGATVRDPVRDGLRGQTSRLSGGGAVAFPAKLLKTALELQGKREANN